MPQSVDIFYKLLYWAWEHWYITLPIFILGEIIIHAGKRRERREDYETAIRNASGTSDSSNVSNINCPVCGRDTSRI